MKNFFLFSLLISFICDAQQKKIRIVFTSDVHFGLKKASFRNADSVSSFEVNRAMAASIRALGKIDAIIITGDIANREENSIQSASASWRQFEQVYKPLHIPLLLLPGNHDISNALGYYKPMSPLTDKGSLAGIYSSMHHYRNLDTVHFQYREDDFNYSRNMGGIHFIFLNLWPDSMNMLWMQKDLQKAGTMPVLIFAHDPPEGDPKQFTKPLGKLIDSEDKFENLLPELYSDHYQKNWDRFLKAHPNIKGYFHGHSNYQEFYVYKGVNGDLSLPCFRVDSPMKGKYSAKDESLLSYQVITIYPPQKNVEVKQFFWNKGKEPVSGEHYLLKL